VQLYFFSYRLGQAFYGICFYLWKTLLPIDLSPLYELPYDFEAWTGVFILCAAVTVLAGLLAFFTRRRWPWLAACLAYYVIVLAPVLGVAQSGAQLVADRYSYLSCLSWAALLGGIGFHWLQSDKSARTAPMLVGILVTGAILGSLTRSQVAVWRDTESLWKHTLEVTPNTAIANYNLGKYYETNGNAQSSVELYRRAIAVNPTHSEAHYNLARLLGQQGKADEAIGHYREALRFKPNDVETLNNLGQLLVLQGNFPAALAAYQKALALDPQFAKAYFNLGRLFVRSGEFDKAIESFQHALKLTPDTAEVYAGLGDAYARSGNVDQAIVHLDAAIKLKPQLAGVQAALARLQATRFESRASAGNQESR
jgi:Flp pilus assembly protein TadD